jgi:metal-responsive CopG/Arc/MetJ family transcriptional regulator
MKAIQIVIDDGLLREADRLVRRTKSNRSALVRQALREHLTRHRLHEMEVAEWRAYEAHPPIEFDVWDRFVTWPKE